MTISTRMLAAALLYLSAFFAQASEITTTLTDADGHPLAEGFVYAVPAQPLASTNQLKTAKFDQVDKEFVPRISVIQQGTSVEFPNSDNIRHQVYSFSPANTFQLKLYSGRPSAPVAFDKPGLVVLGCNIHDHMVAWVLVVDTPWFARSDAQGRVSLRDLPAGKYELLAWHPTAGEPRSAGSITLTERESLTRSIQLNTSSAALAAFNESGKARP
jgi:plastocyanin